MQVTVIYRDPDGYDCVEVVEVDEKDDAKTMLDSALEQGRMFGTMRYDEVPEETIEETKSDFTLIAIIRGKADFIY